MIGRKLEYRHFFAVNFFQCSSATQKIILWCAGLRADLIPEGLYAHHRRACWRRHSLLYKVHFIIIYDYIWRSFLDLFVQYRIRYTDAIRRRRPAPDVGTKPLHAFPHTLVMTLISENVRYCSR